jgi:hypothetical protein
MQSALLTNYQDALHDPVDPIPHLLYDPIPIIPLDNLQDINVDSSEVTSHG